MIICEIGVNHLGNGDYADEYLSALIAARPDAVTFQVREPERYQGEGAELLLPATYYQKAARRIKQAGLLFGMALADENGLEFFESIGTDFYKILSKDIFNESLKQKIFATNKPAWVSSGLSDMTEIKNFSDRLTLGQKNRVRLIHTQLTYEPEDVQLKAIPAMKKLTGLPVAFGCHAKNHNALYASLALSPSDIFFYVRGGRDTRHPDHDHAVPLSAATEVVKNLRELALMLGTGEKKKMANTITK